MLIEFTVGNFRSFRDRVTLSMVASKLKAKDKAIDENSVIVTPGQPDLLSSAAIYGPNASGKSNLIAAFGFMRDLVLTSWEGTEPTGAIRFEPFRLNPRTLAEPGFFQVIFVAEGQRYTYGFEVNEQEVVREWLYTVPTSRVVTLLERDGDAIHVGTNFKGGRGLQQRTRPNALFLSVAAQFNSVTGQKVLRWFRRSRVASGLKTLGMQVYTMDRFVRNRGPEEVIKLVSQLDLGITGIRAESNDMTSPTFPPGMPEEMRKALETLLASGGTTQSVNIKTRHQVYDDAGQPVGETEFDLDRDESSGTQKAFALAGPLLETLKHGRLLLIDELDANLHPLLIESLVMLFNNKETNPNGAQLIFTTQNTNLLSNRLLRRDQVWLVEKESAGVSRLSALSEFKGVRNDLGLEPNYLQGRFGAVPYIGELTTVVREHLADYGTEEKS